jgi:hypothetical protein
MSKVDRGKIAAGRYASRTPLAKTNLPQKEKRLAPEGNKPLSEKPV